MVNQQNTPTGDGTKITHTSSIPTSSYFLPFYLAPKMLFSLLRAIILLHTLIAVLKMDSEQKFRVINLPHEITRNFVIIVAAYKFNINNSKVNQKLLLVK
jgi:hypothetical protein